MDRKTSIVSLTSEEYTQLTEVMNNIKASVKLANILTDTHPLIISIVISSGSIHIKHPHYKTHANVKSVEEGLNFIFNSKRKSYD